jgi:hypothetical protein
MTAVQQVFSDLEKLQPHLFNMHSVEGREFVNHFHKYLEMEKEQITEAHTFGYVIGGGKGDLYNPEQYYNTTFKNTEK